MKKELKKAIVVLEIGLALLSFSLIEMNFDIKPHVVISVNVNI